MTPRTLNEGRYRVLQLTLALAGLASLGGAAAVYQYPTRHPMEWGVFVLCSLLCLGCFPLLHRSRLAGDREAMQRIALVVTTVLSLILLQRAILNLLGPMTLVPGRYLFRAEFGFLPFIYLVMFAMMPAPAARRAAWTLWALFTVLTLGALFHRTGLDFRYDGKGMLLVWMLLANPLFLLILNVVPNYADGLARAESDLEMLREKSVLNAQLAESEQRFNLVVDSLQVGIWDWSVDGSRPHWWSPRYLQMTGFDPGDLARTVGEAIEQVHPDDRETAKAELARQMQAGDLADLYHRVHTKDRGYRWFHTKAKATRNAAGTIVRLTGAVADIHDQRTAEEALLKFKDELSRMAYSDPLTRLSNRRGFDERLKRECERACAGGHALSLLVLDLDHFKQFNDHYGHVAGDDCLRTLAARIEQLATEPGDFTARLGGEEFAVLLPELSADGAVQIAQQVLDAFAALHVPHKGSPLGYVTASIGIATGGGEVTAETLYAQADRALYAAKHRGRNTRCHVRELAA